MNEKTTTQLPENNGCFLGDCLTLGWNYNNDACSIVSDCWEGLGWYSYDSNSLAMSS